MVQYSGWKLKHWPAERTMRFACTKCPRKGQYSLATLIARYGADHPLAGFAAVVAADCPKTEGHYSDRCGAFQEGPSMHELMGGRPAPK